MDYNTNTEKLRLPEYGRLIQKMVAHALTIDNRAVRQAYAERIVAIMAALKPGLRNVPDHRHKLWDHLAYLADYQLDIDYPFEIQRRDENSRPNRLPYPQSGIKNRLYGALLEQAMAKADTLTDEAQRNRVRRLVEVRMKRIKK